jgi:DNA polymerase III alpha subunit
VVFVSLEDESGVANAIVSSALFERRRMCITEETFLQIDGELQSVEGVIHVKARSIVPLLVEKMATPASHDFR